MNADRYAADQHDTRRTADAANAPWTAEDIAFARDHRHTALRAAYALGRSLSAIHNIRRTNRHRES